MPWPRPIVSVEIVIQLLWLAEMLIVFLRQLVMR